MRNPIQSLLEETGLTPTQLAAIARVDVNAIYEYRAGRPRRPSKRFLEALPLIGVDPEEFELDYQFFREEEAAEALEAIAANGGVENDAANSDSDTH